MSTDPSDAVARTPSTVPPEAPREDVDTSEQSYAEKAGANAEPVEEPVANQSAGGEGP
jgi:hypothetical protein